MISPRPCAFVSLDTLAEGRSAALHDGPYGRCVYRCDNDVADNQIVHIGFANGMNASLTVSGFTRENTRTIHLMGSHREMGGNFARNEITVSDFRIDDKRISQLIVPGDSEPGGAYLAGGINRQPPDSLRRRRIPPVWRDGASATPTQAAPGCRITNCPCVGWTRVARCGNTRWSSHAEGSGA